MTIDFRIRANLLLQSRDIIAQLYFDQEACSCTEEEPIDIMLWPLDAIILTVSTIIIRVIRAQ